MSEVHPCIFCKTVINVNYCGLCKKYMCENCSKKYWMRFNAFVDETRAKLGLGGRRY